MSTSQQSQRRDLVLTIVTAVVAAAATVFAVAAGLFVFLR